MHWESFREEVRRASDIVRVTGEYGVTLKKQGRLFKGLCPLHPDKKTPSLVVYPETQSWYCFGCRRGGDVFDFVKERSNCDFSEALRELARRAGITPPSLTPAQEKEQIRQRQKENVLTAAAEYYAEKLTQEVRDYLMKERGFTKGTMAEHRIGYAPLSEAGRSEAFGLLAFLKRRGITKSQAIDAGVLRWDGREYFSGCVILPNWLHGRVVYITGRGYPEKSHKKLLKHKLPLGHLFLEDALGHKEVIITEGETDTYTLRQAGFNACGIYGIGSFKDEWVKKFRNVDKVYISLDGDEAGREGTLRLAELFGDKARVVSFPDYIKSNGEKAKDWNELLVLKHRKDIESFRRDYQGCLERAQTVLEFRIRQIPQDIPQGDLHRALLPILIELAGLSEIEQDSYTDVIIDHFELKLKLSRQSVKKDIKQAQKGIQEAGEERIEVLDDEYPRISPALDFIDGVGYISVPLEAKVTTYPKGIPVTRVDEVPFLVTSNGEFIRLNERELFEKKGLILKSQPLFLDSSRWSLKHIREFQEGFRPDPAEVFQEVKRIYDHYLEFKEDHTADVLALWTTGTYIYPTFESYPYISFTGAKASGKTKTLSVAEKLCFNAIFSSNITSSLLFRIIEGSSCTVLIDEAEKLKHPKLGEELRLLLNAGYKRGGRAHRSKPDTFEPQDFVVFSPKMIASIKGLEEVLESRCIQFVMLRTKDMEKANRVVTESGEDWSHVRHLLYSFGLTFFAEIQDFYVRDTEVKSIRAISGREGELWHPPLAIARFLEKKGCGGLFEAIKEVAVRKSQEARSEGLDEWSNAFLLGLKDVTEEKETDISTRDIKEAMLRYLEDVEKTPSPHWIGGALKRFGLLEKSEKTREGYRYVIRKETIEDVRERYEV